MCGWRWRFSDDSPGISNHSSGKIGGEDSLIALDLRVVEVESGEVLDQEIKLLEVSVNDFLTTTIPNYSVNVVKKAVSALKRKRNEAFFKNKRDAALKKEKNKSVEETTSYGWVWYSSGGVIVGGVAVWAIMNLPKNKGESQKVNLHREIVIND